MRISQIHELTTKLMSHQKRPSSQWVAIVSYQNGCCCWWKCFYNCFPLARIPVPVRKTLWTDGRTDAQTKYPKFSFENFASFCWLFFSFSELVFRAGVVFCCCWIRSRISEFKPFFYCVYRYPMNLEFERKNWE